MNSKKQHISKGNLWKKRKKPYIYPFVNAKDPDLIRTYEQRDNIEELYRTIIIELKILGNNSTALSSPTSPQRETCYKIANVLEQIRVNRHLDFIICVNGERRIRTELYYNVAKELPSLMKSIRASNLKSISYLFSHIEMLQKRASFQLSLQNTSSPVSPDKIQTSRPLQEETER